MVGSDGAILGAKTWHFIPQELKEMLEELSKKFSTLEDISPELMVLATSLGSSGLELAERFYDLGLEESLRRCGLD